MIDASMASLRQSGSGALPLLAHVLRGRPGAPVVTFIPGIGNDRSFWGQQADSLADTCQVLLFDHWGHGESPAPPRPCNLAAIVAGIVGLWDELGIASSNVVGLGFGGSVALLLAVEHPARVESVVACCCRPRQPDDRREFWRDRHAKAAELGMARIADMTVDRWLSDRFRADHQEIDRALRSAMKRTSLAGYQALISAFIEMDFTDRLQDIACPVHLVAAENDHGGGPVPAMENMARQIPGSRLTIVPDAGHIVVAEAPDTVTAILRDALPRAGGPA